jgi:hypothetical protein
MAQACSIADLFPDLAAAYSPNPYQWFRRRATGRKEGLGLNHVYQVRAGSKLADHCGAGALLIGSPYEAYEDDADLSAVRMMEVLCHGAAATTSCLAGALNALDELPDFWAAYQRIGRCAIDVEHKTSFVDSARYTTANVVKTCLWCGQQYRAAN